MKTPRFHEVLIMLLAVGAVFFLGTRTACNGPKSTKRISPSLYAPKLLQRDYSEAETGKKPCLPPPLGDLKPGAVVTVSGEGYWTPSDTLLLTDTLQVKVSAVEMDDGSKWVRVLLDGKPVHMETLEWYKRPVELGRWSGGLETVVTHGGDMGLFAGYRLFNIGPARIEGAVAVDYNGASPFEPEWVAAEARAAVPVWRSVELGGGVGPHLTREEVSWHGSAGVGVRF